MDDTEALLVARSTSAEVEQVVGGVGQVTQRISPRVAVVELLPGGFRALSARRDVARLFRPGDSADELDALGLDENELLFARAWFLRHAGKADRPGDGQPWDAPGYLPPDRS